MDRLFWIIQLSPKCNHTYAYKREIEGHLTTDRKGKGHVTMEADIAVMPPQAKECQQPPEAGKNKKQILC